MLTYALDKTAGVSLYEQLYRRVKEDILSGRLAAGEKLPSKRALAAHLEVSVITVKNAYEQLMAEGYLTGVEKKGYFVSSVLPPLPSQPPPVTQDAPEPGERTWFLDLVTNSIDAEDFPFTVWARLMRQTILEQGTGLLHPTPPPPLLKAAGDVATRGICEPILVGGEVVHAAQELDHTPHPAALCLAHRDARLKAHLVYLCGLAQVVYDLGVLGKQRRTREGKACPSLGKQGGGDASDVLLPPAVGSGLIVALDHGHGHGLVERWTSWAGSSCPARRTSPFAPPPP